MDAEVVKIVLPIATFVLGCAFTLLLKKTEQRKGTLKSAAESAARLSRDWYNQIHALIISPIERNGSGELNTAIYDYVHNRLILPEFMMHLEILKRDRRGAKIVAALEEFLNEVTYPVSDYPEGRACAEILTSQLAAVIESPRLALGTDLAIAAPTRDITASRSSPSTDSPGDIPAVFERWNAGRYVAKRLDGRDRSRLLRTLDVHVQRITREAAAILGS